jgi:hypothetical protein
MGLFPEGFDLSQIFGPAAANAAGGFGPNGAPIGSPTEQDLLNSPQAADALAPKPVGTQMIEPNPSPVMPGQVPLPRPFPGVQRGQGGSDIVPPDEASRSLTLNAGAPEPSPVVPPGGIGAALRGSGVDDLAARAPAAGAEGPVAPASSTPATDQRPSLAQALKGAQMPAAPVQQKISSPNAPRPTGQIKSGDLQALLLALNAAGGPGMPRPTLGGRG